MGCLRRRLAGILSIHNGGGEDPILQILQENISNTGPYAAGDVVELICALTQDIAQSYGFTLQGVNGGSSLYYWEGPTQTDPKGWHSGNRKPVRVNAPVWMSGTYYLTIQVDGVLYTATMEVVIS